MRGFKALALALTAVLLAGCDTDEELLRQRLNILKAEEAALRELQVELSARPEVEGSGTVSLFLSQDTINGILAGADGVVVPLPSIEGGEVIVKSLRASFRTGFPLVLVQATARKKGLDVTLDLEGVARIQPTIVDSGTPKKLQLRVHVDSLVPNARWSVFDFRINGFVKDLLQVKLSDAARTAGVIEIPVETSLLIKLPAQAFPASFPGVNVSIAAPGLSLVGSASLARIITLPDGLHVYGRLQAGVSQ